MTHPGNILKRKEEIQLLVASDNLNKAVKRMMDFIRDFSEDAVALKTSITLSTNLSKVEKSQKEDANNKTLNEERTKIAESTLTLLESVLQQAV